MFLLTNKTMDKLKYDLVREGLVELDKLNYAEDTAQTNNTNLAQELINENVISEAELLNFIEKKLHIPSVELSDYAPDTNCLKYVNSDDAIKYNIFPLFKIEDVLTVAMSDPLDLFTINRIFSDEDISVEPVICSYNAIKFAINKYYALKNNDIENWQDALLGDNINDEKLKKVISDILTDAINHEQFNIFMEKNSGGLNLFFNKELKGFIPNLLVPRFIYELKLLSGIDTEIDDVPQNSKFIFEYNSSDYICIISIFPTKYGLRIALQINKPLKAISQYNFEPEYLKKIFEKPSLICLKGAKTEEVTSLAYTLVQAVNNKNILMVEDKVLYELRGVNQLEFDNTAINFDEIVNNINFQKFDVIFWQHVYTKEQLKKLKLLAHDCVVVTADVDDENDFDFVITSSGKIIEL